MRRRAEKLVKFLTVEKTKPKCDCGARCGTESLAIAGNLDRIAEIGEMARYHHAAWETPRSVAVK